MFPYFQHVLVSTKLLVCFVLVISVPVLELCQASSFPERGDTVTYFHGRETQAGWGGRGIDIKAILIKSQTHRQLTVYRDINKHCSILNVPG